MSCNASVQQDAIWQFQNYQVNNNNNNHTYNNNNLPLQHNSFCKKTKQNKTLIAPYCWKSTIWWLKIIKKNKQIITCLVLFLKNNFFPADCLNWARMTVKFRDKYYILSYIWITSHSQNGKKYGSQTRFSENSLMFKAFWLFAAGTAKCFTQPYTWLQGSNDTAATGWTQAGTYTGSAVINSLSCLLWQATDHWNLVNTSWKLFFCYFLNSRKHSVLRLTLAMCSKNTFRLLWPRMGV